MAEPAKYMFDRSFGPSSNKPLESPTERKMKADFERRIAEARQGALTEGRTEGERAARATIEAETSRTLTAVLAQVKEMQAVMNSEFDAIHAHAVKVAVTVAERLSYEFLRREPLSEIETLVSDCLGHLSQTPNMVVRLNDAVAEEARQRLEEIAVAQSFSGQLTVIGDARIAAGDCRLEWAEGGITRDFQATLDSIQKAIDRHMAARQREVRLRDEDTDAGPPSQEPRAGTEISGDAA